MAMIHQEVNPVFFQRDWVFLCNLNNFNTGYG
ncbi:Uncharacterised protein [Mycobacterium tuberculosis]|nr:Uncharacterised protein [Mycobacterium tuberculosis]